MIKQQQSCETKLHSDVEMSGILDTLDVSHRSIIPERPTPATFLKQMIKQLSMFVTRHRKLRKTDLIVR